MCVSLPPSIPSEINLLLVLLLYSILDRLSFQERHTQTICFCYFSWVSCLLSLYYGMQVIGDHVTFLPYDGSGLGILGMPCYSYSLSPVWFSFLRSDMIFGRHPAHLLHITSVTHKPKPFFSLVVLCVILSFFSTCTSFMTLNTGYRGTSSIPLGSSSSLIPASILINNDTLIMRGRFLPRVHDGNYNCVAKNSVGSTKSNTIHLQIKGTLIHIYSFLLSWVNVDDVNSISCESFLDEVGIHAIRTLECLKVDINFWIHECLFWITQILTAV